MSVKVVIIIADVWTRKMVLIKTLHFQNDNVFILVVEVDSYMKMLPSKS